MIKKYKELIKFLEKSEFSFDKNLIKKHCIDWREDYLYPNLIIFPKSVEKLSKLVKICNRKNIKIVPQGGNTGLVGGSVPRKK